jgi:hypothetical protein
MKMLEEELLKIGSLYIHRGEVLQDSSSKAERAIPTKDRLQLLEDLLLREADF